MKPCNINSLYEKSCDLDFCFYCFIGEFLLMADRKVFFWFVNAQTRSMQVK